jgi:hypothetical protein
MAFAATLTRPSNARPWCQHDKLRSTFAPSSFWLFLLHHSYFFNLTSYWLMISAIG